MGDRRGKPVRWQADLLRVAAEAAVDEHTAAAPERTKGREGPQHLRLCTAVARGALALGHPQLKLRPDRWRTPHAVFRNPKLFTQVHAGVGCSRGRKQQPARTSLCVTHTRGTVQVGCCMQPAQARAEALWATGSPQPHDELDWLRQYTMSSSHM